MCVKINRLTIVNTQSRRRDESRKHTLVIYAFLCDVCTNHFHSRSSGMLKSQSPAGYEPRPSFGLGDSTCTHRRFALIFQWYIPSNRNYKLLIPLHFPDQVYCFERKLVSYSISGHICVQRITLDAVTQINSQPHHRFQPRSSQFNLIMEYNGAYLDDEGNCRIWMPLWSQRRATVCAWKPRRPSPHTIRWLMKKNFLAAQAAADASCGINNRTKRAGCFSNVGQGLVGKKQRYDDAILARNHQLGLNTTNTISRITSYRWHASKSNEDRRARCSNDQCGGADIVCERLWCFHHGVDDAGMDPRRREQGGAHSRNLILLQRWQRVIYVWLLIRRGAARRRKPQKPYPGLRSGSYVNTPQHLLHQPAMHLRGPQTTQGPPESVPLQTACLLKGEKNRWRKSRRMWWTRRRMRKGVWDLDDTLRMKTIISYEVF